MTLLFLTFLAVGGILAGLLLLRSVPILDAELDRESDEICVSVIIPARNEEINLPPLLRSLRVTGTSLPEVLVIDDSSTDRTVSVAHQHGAKVIAAEPLPKGWTGKTWACHQGALAASGKILLFLDADTRFLDGGYSRIIEHFCRQTDDTVLSILPFHATRCLYEELSLFFNILLAMGAGGFGKLDRPHLFGQTLLIHRDLYARAGGHKAVKGQILENLHFSAKILAAGGNIGTFGGYGTMEMRMFPQGVSQLCESWQKAFTTGAANVSPIVLMLSILWLSSAALVPIMLVSNPLWQVFAGLYLLNIIQIAWYGRQLGTFRWFTAALYPLALTFYFALFGYSIWHKTRNKPVTWRGRRV